MSRERPKKKKKNWRGGGGRLFYIKKNEFPEKKKNQKKGKGERNQGKDQKPKSETEPQERRWKGDSKFSGDFDKGEKVSRKKSRHTSSSFRGDSQNPRGEGFLKRKGPQGSESRVLS